MKRTVAGVLIVVMLAAFAGCGQDLSKYAGTYKCISIESEELDELIGDNEFLAEIIQLYLGAMSLELREDGTGTMKNPMAEDEENQTFEFTWSVKDAKIIMKVDGQINTDIIEIDGNIITMTSISSGDVLVLEKDVE